MQLLNILTIGSAKSATYYKYIEFRMSAPVRAAVLSMLTLVIFAQCAWLALEIYKYKSIKRSIVPVIMLVVLAAITTILNIKNGLLNGTLELSGDSEKWLNIPDIGFLFMAFLISYFSILCAIVEYKRSLENLSKNSIKESADNLPIGLCYYTGDGQPVFANIRMEQLALELTGRSLRNARDLVKHLSSGPLPKDNYRIIEGDNLAVRTSSGIVWTFSNKSVEVNGDKLFELMAIDTTSIHNMWKELSQDNNKLSEMNARLRSYSNNITDLIRAEEILKEKVRIHDEIGETLLASRYYLEQNAEVGSVDRFIKMWEKDISLLKRESVEEDSTDPLLQIINAGQAIGLLIIVDGDLPKKDITALRLINAAMRECMTNAVKHAQATELYMSVKKANGFYEICFTDNGSKTIDEIAEGGGLSTLRQTVENAYGTMELAKKGRFELRLQIPVGER